MIAEAFRYLTSLARESVAPYQIAAENPDLTRYFAAGKLLEFPRPLPARDHEVQDIDDFIALVGRLANVPIAEGDEPDLSRTTVWATLDRVVAVFDDDQRRLDRATLRMHKTTLFETIEHLGDPMEHRDFLRLLRVQLQGALAPGTLLEKVRRVDFENGTVVRAKVGRADESLGREITGKVTANGELPESVVLEANLWRNYGYAARVPCAVEVDALRGTLALVPFPDAIDEATEAGLTSLTHYLIDQLRPGIGVYRGRPEFSA
ncbi:hypothetical protein AB1L88_15840 [Tautonia sp. JC769]|uniref:hypothetical protein n=1 Tax=Tautonia sp. JC769 TaxID=3232135 RepID=UPI00345980BE